MSSRIAVTIPCYNEEPTIDKVVSDTKKVLPEATIYVFDNNSTNKIAQLAASLGAIVIKEKRQDKEFVIQSMFNRIDAEIYVMFDGSDTYDFSRINEMISTVNEESADIMVGTRLKTYTRKAFRPLQILGNRLLKFLVNLFFCA